MNYYNNKINAQKVLKHLIESRKHTTKTELLLFVMENYGFSKRFLDNYLTILQDSGFIVIDGEIIRWVETLKTPKEIQDEAEATFILKQHQILGTPAEREE